jgi:predicted nucleotidyltransferase
MLVNSITRGNGVALPQQVEVLPDTYQQLLERALVRFRADDRVRAVWLGGSLARGTADSASDLDLLLAVDDGAYEEFVAGWRAWLADITPTVIASAVPFVEGAFYSVTSGFERFDVVVERVSALPASFYRTRVVVFDQDGLDGHVPAPVSGRGPSADAVSALVTEYFRISAVETILVRDDWLLAREHLHVVSSLIYRLFLEANAPLPMMGVKQWATKLNHRQRAVLLSLPTAASEVEELRHAHLAHACAFLTNAEALARQLGQLWPAELEDAAAAHLRRTLGLDDPYPRSPEALAV